MNQEIEKMKETQECERKKKIAEERHREWVQKKNEEVKLVMNFFIFKYNLIFPPHNDLIVLHGS